MLYVWAHQTVLVEHFHYHPYAEASSFLSDSGGCWLNAPAEHSSSEAKEIELIS